MYVKYHEQVRYDFACQFLDLSFSEEEKRQQVTYFNEDLAFELKEDTLAQLLERINDEKLPVILPSLKAWRWLVTAPTLRQLEQVLTRIGHFTRANVCNTRSRWA